MHLHKLWVMSRAFFWRSLICLTFWFLVGFILIMFVTWGEDWQIWLWDRNSRGAYLSISVLLALVFAGLSLTEK